MKTTGNTAVTGTANQSPSLGVIVIFFLIPSFAMIVLGLWTNDNAGIIIAAFVTGAIMVIRHKTHKWLGTATIALYGLLIGSGLWHHDFWLITTGFLLAGIWEFILRSKRFDLRA